VGEREYRARGEIIKRSGLILVDQIIRMGNLTFIPAPFSWCERDIDESRILS